MKKIVLVFMMIVAPSFAADVIVTPGVGKTVHTDTAGGVEYQYIKIADGTTGGVSSATVSSIGLRVDLATTTIVGSTVALTASQTVGNSSGTVAMQLGLNVSSTSVPTPTYTDGKIMIWTGTPLGQALVTGVPFGITISSYGTGVTTMTAVSATGSEGVLFSTPTAIGSTFTYICGCEFANTVSTGTVIIESPTNTIASRFPIGLQASPTPQGFWPGCTNPFYRSAPFSNIYIYVKGTSAVPLIADFRCLAYQGP